MQSISSVAELKNAIQLLEVEQMFKGKLLKEQFYLVYESFKPVNLITGTLNEIVKSPFLVDNLLGTVMGLATGFLSKKLLIGASGSKIKRLIVTVLQVGITNIISQNSDSIKSFGSFLFRSIFRKRGMKTEKP